MIPSEDREKKRLKKNIQRTRDLGDNSKCISVQVMRVQEEEREKGAETLFEEIMSKNFINLMKNIYLQVKEAQQTQVA